MNIWKVLRKTDKLMCDKNTNWDFLPEKIRNDLEWTNFTTVSNQWKFKENFLLQIALIIECNQELFADYVLAAKGILEKVRELE